MKFDRLMDFVTYALLAMIGISLIYVAVSVLFELKSIREDMEALDKIEYIP